MNSLPNTIPPMTDPMGKHWRQPAVDGIALDDTHALMSKQTFDALPEYSATQPSGVYEGKMWKRRDGLHDRSCVPEDRKWLLCWFDKSDKGPEWCSTRFRVILIG